MSLFKVNRGNESNLPSKITDGWAYFCTDTGSFLIDHYDSTNTLVRSKISAKYADMLRYVKDGETIELDPAVIVEQIANKVDKVSGKGLSTNDFDDTYKAKLDGIEDEANKTIVDSELSSTSTNPVQNKVIQKKFNALQAEVDGKSDSNHNHDGTYSKTGHTHSYLPLSGGTIDGRLSVHGYGNNGGLNLNGYQGRLELRANIGTSSIEGVDGTNKAGLTFGPNKESAKEGIIFSMQKDGVYSQYKLYGEHNKPTANDIGAASTMSVTTSEYNTMSLNNELNETTLYMLTDDTSEEDLQATVDEMNNIDYDTYLAFDTNEIV